MRVWNRVRGANEKFYGGPVTKFGMFRQPNTLALIFDGWRVFDKAHLDASHSNLSARHNKQKAINVLFADFHAESVDIGSFPQTNLPFATNLEITKFKFPRWRMGL